MARRRKSKKRSGAKPDAQPPESPTFFIDRSLGGGFVANRLRALGFDVVHHDDHFAPNELDQVWLAEAGRQGWVVLTKDKRIRHRTVEREALIAAGVAAFVLTSGNVTGEQMADAFAKGAKRMVRMLSRTKRPFIARVTRSGDVALLPMDK